MNNREVPFEYVRLAGKAPIHVSQHEKDGISEEYIKSQSLALNFFLSADSNAF